VELIDELKLLGKPAAWLILRPKKDGSIEQEVVLTPLTDEHNIGEGDEAWPLYLKLPPNAVLSGAATD